MLGSVGSLTLLQGEDRAEVAESVDDDGSVQVAGDGSGWHVDEVVVHLVVEAHILRRDMASRFDV